MRKTFFFLFLGIFYSTDLLAQLKSAKLVDNINQILEIAIPDISNRHIFKENLSLKSISVIYKNEWPYYVNFNFNDSKNKYGKSEHYDLAFEGDSLLLNQKYGYIHVIDLKSSIKSIWGKKDTTTSFTISSTAIYRDTVFYRFFQQWPGMEIKKTNPEGIVGMPAKYKGDLEVVGAQIVKQLKAKRNTEVTDSTLVFQGTISKNGKLEALELVVGQASALSEITEEVLLRKDGDISTGGERYEWNAANIDRGPIESKARIYVKLEPEGKVTIKTPRVLRTFTGL